MANVVVIDFTEAIFRVRKCSIRWIRGEDHRQVWGSPEVNTYIRNYPETDEGTRGFVRMYRVHVTGVAPRCPFFFYSSAVIAFSTHP